MQAQLCYPFPSYRRFLTPLQQTAFWKHSDKRRNCTKRAISSFATMFSTFGHIHSIIEIFYVLTKYVQSRLLQNCRMGGKGLFDHVPHVSPSIEDNFGKHLAISILSSNFTFIYSGFPYLCLGHLLRICCMAVFFVAVLWPGTGPFQLWKKWHVKCDETQILWNFSLLLWKKRCLLIVNGAQFRPYFGLRKNTVWWKGI